MCYSVAVKTIPLSIRLDSDLQLLLSEGARRTKLSQRELLRRTLRLHLREVIDSEALAVMPKLTNVEPWPRGALAKAYRRKDQDWERVEAAATTAQGQPSFDD